MSNLRSFSGFILALAIGYAAGILMCVDAYHLGQSNAIKNGWADPSGVCLPHRPKPVDDMPNQIDLCNPINAANKHH